MTPTNPDRFTPRPTGSEGPAIHGHSAARLAGLDDLPDDRPGRRPFDALKDPLSLAMELHRAELSRRLWHDD